MNKDRIFQSLLKEQKQLKGSTTEQLQMRIFYFNAAITLLTHELIKREAKSKKTKDKK